MATSQNAAYNASKAEPLSRPCLCSPTTHPGSFRCSFHRISSRKNLPRRSTGDHGDKSPWALTVAAQTSALKALLLQIINPSNHRLQRRRNFRPRPSRFYVNMNNNKNRNGFAVS